MENASSFGSCSSFHVIVYQMVCFIKGKIPGHSKPCHHRPTCVVIGVLAAAMVGAVLLAFFGSNMFQAAASQGRHDATNQLTWFFFTSFDETNLYTHQYVIWWVLLTTSMPKQKPLDHFPQKTSTTDLLINYDWTLSPMAKLCHKWHFPKCAPVIKES